MRDSGGARRSRAHITPFTLALLLALVAGLVVLTPAPAAHATHFRFRDLTWNYDHAVPGGNVVELTMRIADRRSYYSGISVGGPFSTTVSTGDGGSARLDGEVVSVNTVDDWFIAEVRGYHTYPTAGPYTVSWQSCCTLSTLRNSPDSSLRTTTVVDVTEGNRASPVSLVSPIVHLPATQGVQTFRIPATDADGDSVGFRLATQAESLVTQPPGLAIDERTGVISWDTTGRPDGLWMVTVVLSDGAGATTMNTFLVNLGGSASQPPAWVSPTPVDRSNISAEVGLSTNFTLAAEDPDGDRVTITALNAPPGLTCGAETVAGSRTERSCTWEPPDTTSHLVAFVAQDQTGASSSLRSFRITGPRYVAFGDSYASGEGALDASNYEEGTDGDQGGNGCRRASTAYSYYVGASVSTPGDLHFVACSGARTWHFYEAQAPDHDTPQLPQFDMADLGADVELVTLSIGGNDAGFSDIIKECVFGFELLPWNHCSSDAGKSEEPVQDALARLRGEPTQYDKGNPKTVALSRIYEQIRRQAPRARVMVVGYPQFFRTGGTSFFRCSGVDKVDQQWTNEKVAEMNEMLREEAENLGLEFVDVSPVFETHRLCEVGGGEEQEWFRDIQLDLDWPVADPAGFHPDDDGHYAMALEILDSYRNGPQPITMSTGDVQRFTVAVSDALQKVLSVVARWPGSDVEITLTSPSGVVYHRGAMPDGAKHLLGPTYEVIQVPTPEVGEWTVELFGADLGTDGEPVWFSSNVQPQWNYPPVAQIAYEVTGNVLHLDATASSDPEGDELVEYAWFLSDQDGTFAELSGATVEYQFDRAGQFGVSLRVKDARGKSGFAGVTEAVTVGATYAVEGPMAPLDPSAEWTVMQAGRAVPVVWRLTKDGAPVDDPAHFAGITSRPVGCDGDQSDSVYLDGETPGSSTLVHRGDGTWHMNWDTDRSWSGTCRELRVAFDDGSSLEVRLRFR